MSWENSLGMIMSWIDTTMLLFNALNYYLQATVLILFIFVFTILCVVYQERFGRFANGY